MTIMIGTTLLSVVNILIISEKMSFNTVIFIPADETITEREKQMVQRTAGEGPLFIVMDSEKKARELSNYIESLDDGDYTIISLHNPDSRYLLPYLAGTVCEGAVIDITFASSYYASSVTLLTFSKTAKITYTQWDGSVSVIHQSRTDPAVMDDQSKWIVCSLMSGPRTLNELEKGTGMNYKTLARRTSNLLREGYISKTDDYPLRYFLTEEQEREYSISCHPEERKTTEGKVFRSAMEALLTEDNYIIGTLTVD